MKHNIKIHVQTLFSFSTGSEEDVAVTCDKCKKQFQNKNQLCSHQLLVHMPKEASEHRCSKCGKVFQAAAFLQTHLCNRSGQRDHECQICKTRFTTGSSLKMHVRNHFYVLKCNRLYLFQDCSLVNQYTLIRDF